MNLFSDTTKQKIDSGQNNLFSKIKDDAIYLYQGSLQDYSRKKRIPDTKNKLRTHHSIEKKTMEITGWFVSYSI